MANNFNVGNDVTLVFTGGNGRIDFGHVSEWEAKPATQHVKIKPLNSPPLQRDLPEGWTFSFSIDRSNVNLDAYQAQKEANFWAGGQDPVETLYAYIAENDGSTSTWAFLKVASTFTDAGRWSQDAAVKQKFEGFASQRIQVT